MHLRKIINDMLSTGNKKQAVERLEVYLDNEISIKQLILARKWKRQIESEIGNV